MKHVFFFSAISILALAATGCNSAGSNTHTGNDTAKENISTNAGLNVTLPEPSKSNVNFSNVIGWDSSRTPVAPAGFTVSKFAQDLDNPRWIYILPDGDVLVSEANTGATGIRKVKDVVDGKAHSGNETKSANVILIFHGMDANGKPKSVSTFLGGLNRPLGMLVLGNWFYVGNTDGIVRYPYTPGQMQITGQGQKIVDLPAEGYNNHWTRNIVANADGSKLYISVGSGSNVAEHGIEHEVHRANILECNPDGTALRVYASGLRNPVGMGFAPGTHTLWTSVNERDELGDDLVPDYLTSVKDGGFYGWPYSYWGQHVDTRIEAKDQKPDLVKKALVPDVPLGAHTASLGLAFYDKSAFPAKYHNGAFIGQHGSWNRSVLAGYKIAFVPFANGKPTGPAQDFLTGFVADADKSKVYGRPVGVAIMQDGSMLVADDAGNTIWRVAATK